MVWTTGVEPGQPTRTMRALPAFTGSNFTDVSLQVIVCSAPGTLVTFQPSKLHGTTGHGKYFCDPVVRSVALNSTTRVYDGYMKMLESDGSLFQAI